MVANPTPPLLPFFCYTKIKNPKKGQKPIKIMSFFTLCFFSRIWEDSKGITIAKTRTKMLNNNKDHVFFGGSLILSSDCQLDPSTTRSFNQTLKLKQNGRQLMVIF
uniref:Putative ovule protein n=1 Tax=Solanum chacoense TaxID=4108 RepID=A0A0V0HJW1_SOLCH